MNDIRPAAAPPRGNAGWLRRLPGPMRWVIGALIGVAFQADAVRAVLTSAAPAWAIGLGLTGLVAIAVCYVAVIIPARSWPLPRQLVLVGFLVAVAAALEPLVSPTGVLALWIFASISGAMLLAARPAIVLAVGLAAAGILWSLAAGSGAPWQLAFTVIALSLWMVAFAANIRLAGELRRTRGELAEAAVTAERERIARDLHDILGHSLTAVAVKAGLARRMLGGLAESPRRDAVEAEITEVEQLARDALADVRATAVGTRELSLAAELAAAGSLLRAADISADLPTAVTDVSPAGRQVFGYVVREAVTNVLRHSNASSCVIALTADSVTITDNGRLLPNAGRSGHGLSGLADRVGSVGGSMESGPLPGGGFEIRATVPSDAQASARAAATLSSSGSG